MRTVCRLAAVVKKLVLIFGESLYFYWMICKIIIWDRCFMSGIVLVVASPYILAVNAVMHFIPNEYQDKVLPFVYTMQ